MEPLPPIEPEVLPADREIGAHSAMAWALKTLAGVSIAAATVIAAKHFKNALVEAKQLHDKGE